MNLEHTRESRIDTSLPKWPSATTEDKRRDMVKAFCSSEQVLCAIDEITDHGKKLNLQVTPQRIITVFAALTAALATNTAVFNQAYQACQVSDPTAMQTIKDYVGMLHQKCPDGLEALAEIQKSLEQVGHLLDVLDGEYDRMCGGAAPKGGPGIRKEFLATDL